jgi:hypothetical protein
MTLSPFIAHGPPTVCRDGQQPVAEKREAAVAMVCKYIKTHCHCAERVIAAMAEDAEHFEEVAVTASRQRT